MKRNYSFVVRRRSELKSVAQTVLAYAKTHKRSRALVLALEGPLGAGKTTFAQILARLLGARSRTVSPSFVLMRSQAIPGGRFIHIDAWRLKLCEARDDLDLKNIVRDPRNVIAVEWADRIRSLIPRSAAWIRLRHRAAGGRTVTIQVP